MQPTVISCEKSFYLQDAEGIINKLVCAVLHTEIAKLCDLLNGLERTRNISTKQTDSQHSMVLH